MFKVFDSKKKEFVESETMKFFLDEEGVLYCSDMKLGISKCREEFIPVFSTEWKEIPSEIPRDKDYWWKDANNKTAIGKVLRSGSFSFLDSHQEKSFNWNLVIKYAEIKPPNPELME